MKHIIWITPGFAADEHDSQCIPPLQLLAKSLAAEKEIQLHIISLHYSYRNEGYTWHGAQVYPCYRSRPWKKWRIRTAAYQQLKQLLAKHPKALVHSFWMNDACLVALIANRRFKRPHLVTLMGQDARPDNRYLHILAHQPIFKVALSTFHATTFATATGKKVDKIIPWGIPSSSTQASEGRQYDLIAVGNLIPLKQFDIFVRLVARLREERPKLQALLIGDGPQRPALEALAQSLGVSTHITFTGAIPREKVMNHLAQSKVLVHPSSYESYGFVLVEALQQGCQVVASPVGIAPEIPGIRTVENLEEMVIASRLALEDSRKPVLPERYHLADCKDEYLRLYERLLASSAK